MYMSQVPNLRDVGGVGGVGEYREPPKYMYMYAHLFCMPDRFKRLRSTLDMCFDMVSI